jgi:GMP synthase (glutamine-hydrolysing)
MKKLLIFQHIAREHPSYIFDYVVERKYEIDVVKLWEGGIIPDVSAYDGLIVLGGPMGVYEEYTGKEEELAAISQNIGTTPMLGICLGAQLLAHALGARVYPHEVDGKHVKEVGYYSVNLTDEGIRHRLFKGFKSPVQVLQWHGDTFDLPEEATLLASDVLCKNQAFCKGNVCGLQFHVETTPELIEEWLQEDAAWTHTDFDLDEEKTLADAKKLAPLMKVQCYKLLDNFLGS